MNSIRRILVIRFRRVGDAVLSSALCSSLKQSFPDATIDYVLNQGIAPLFENHPDIDNLIAFDNHELKSIFRYIKKIREVVKKGDYDIIIDTRSTVNTLLFSALSLKSRFRIGRKKAYTKLFLTHTVENSDGEDMVSLTLKLLKPLEKFHPIRRYEHHFKLYVTEEEKDTYARYLQEKGIDLSKPIIFCAVATRIPEKRWDNSFMAEVLNKMMAQHPDIQLIFNYAGKEEKEVALEVHRLMNYNSNVFIHIEAKGLRELATLISHSSFFFGNEGGARHVSQAFDIPSFAIFPPNIEKHKWLPNISERFQGIESADVSKEAAESPDLSYQEKFSLITPDEVWKRLEAMLRVILLEGEVSSKSRTTAAKDIIIA